LDPAIRHTVVHHSSTSTYIPNFIQIEETFCGRTDGRTFSPLILLGRLLEVDLKNDINSIKLCLSFSQGLKIQVVYFIKRSSFWGVRPQTPCRGFASGTHWGTSVPHTRWFPPTAPSRSAPVKGSETISSHRRPLSRVRGTAKIKPGGDGRFLSQFGEYSLVVCTQY